jgi:hypothetical protein
MFAPSFQHLYLRLANAVAPFKVDAHLADRLNKHEELPVNVLIVGPSNSGVQQLIQGLQGRLRGCVVQLALVQQDLPGWVEAPYEGEYYPANVTKPWGMDLAEAVRSRLPGVFRLEMPASVFDGQDHRATLLRQGISSELRRLVCPPPSTAITSPTQRVTLIVEAGDQLLTDDVLFMYSRFGRNANCSLVFVQDAPTPASVDLQMTADMVVTLGNSPDIAGTMEPLMKIPEGSVLKLKEQQGWCRDRAAWKTWFFQLADASAAGQAGTFV